MPEHKPRPVRIALIQQGALSSDPEQNKADLCQVIDRLAGDADFVDADGACDDSLFRNRP